MDSCIVCDQTVRPRQEALLCDGCDRWQHRTCQTGISQLAYREAVSSGKSIDWRCVECEGPIMNSTPLLFTDDEQSHLPANPDVEFESQSPYQSDLPVNPDADLEPPSPANQSDLPVEPALNESSARQNRPRGITSPAASPSVSRSSTTAQTKDVRS